MSQADLQHFVDSHRAKLANLPLSVREGRVKRVSGLLVEVEGLPLSIGAQACVENSRQGNWVDAECIGFERDTTYLMAFDQMAGLSPGAVVYPLLTPQRRAQGYQMRQGIASVPIGPQLLGRVVDGLGRPLDGLGGASWSDALMRFATTLEKVTVDAVEDGWMTKDLALLIGPDQAWMTTEKFFEAVRANLDAAIVKGL